MKKFIAIFVTILGCANSPPSLHCGNPAGLYQYHYNKESGDCPDIPDFSIVFPIRASANQCMAVASNDSADNCSGSFDNNCTGLECPGGGSCVATEIGTVDSNADGSQLTGTLSLSMQQEQIDCITNCPTILYNCSAIYNWIATKVHD